MAGLYQKFHQVQYFIQLNHSIYSVKLHFTSSPRPCCSLNNKHGQWHTLVQGVQLQSILENSWHLSLCLFHADIQLKHIGCCIPSVYNYSFFVFCFPIHTKCRNTMHISIHFLNCERKFITLQNNRPSMGLDLMGAKYL